jgi:hypothetical protein
MTWTLRRPKKPSAFSVRSGSDGEKHSSGRSPATTTSQQNKGTHSLPSSQGLMIGWFLLSPHLQDPKDFYKPFTQEELNMYIGSIRTKKDMNHQLQHVQNCMVEAEKCLGSGVLSKDEHRTTVTKLTQLFKSLLHYKERHIFSPHMGSVPAKTIPTHLFL